MWWLDEWGTAHEQLRDEVINWLFVLVRSTSL